MKPDTELKQKDTIRNALRQAFVLSNIDGPIMEFWLQSHGQALRIQDKTEQDPVMADRSWVHVLFNAVWAGDDEVAQAIRRQLLLSYFMENNDQLFGRNLRPLCLEQLERDTLQYRLMHKGYERFFPTRGLSTPHAHLIDGQSAFWDAGYRQTATRLFLHHVFLPHIHKK